MIKKYKLIFIILLCFLFTGCEEYGEKRIVKLITIDQEQITLYYYDYMSDNTSYLKESIVNTGIENSITELLFTAEYDLKLCEYVVCDNYTIRNNVPELFYCLMNSKFSPNIKIIEGDLSDNNEKYINLKNINFPVYSYCINDNKMNAVIDNADSKEKNIIINNAYYKKIPAEESFLLDILLADIKEGFYNFKSDGKKYSAELENINVICSNKNNMAYVNINAVLKSYKGLSSGKEEKSLMTNIIKNSIENNLDNLLSDHVMTDNLNLLWFKKLYNAESVKITVNIK